MQRPVIVTERDAMITYLQNAVDKTSEEGLGSRSSGEKNENSVSLWVKKQRDRVDNIIASKIGKVYDSIAARQLVSNLKSAATAEFDKKALLLLFCAEPLMRNAMRVTTDIIYKSEPTLRGYVQDIIRATLILQQSPENCIGNKTNEKLCQLQVQLTNIIADIKSNFLDEISFEKIANIWLKINHAFEGGAVELQESGWFTLLHQFSNNQSPPAHSDGPVLQHIKRCLDQVPDEYRQEMCNLTTHRILPSSGIVHGELLFKTSSQDTSQWNLQFEGKLGHDRTTQPIQGNKEASHSPLPVPHVGRRAASQSTLQLQPEIISQQRGEIADILVTLSNDTASLSEIASEKRFLNWRTNIGKKQHDIGAILRDMGDVVHRRTSQHMEDKEKALDRQTSQNMLLVGGTLVCLLPVAISFSYRFICRVIPEPDELFTELFLGRLPMEMIQHLIASVVNVAKSQLDTLAPSRKQSFTLDYESGLAQLLSQKGDSLIETEMLTYLSKSSILVKGLLKDSVVWDLPESCGALGTPNQQPTIYKKVTVDMFHPPLSSSVPEPTIASGDVPSEDSAGVRPLEVCCLPQTTFSGLFTHDKGGILRKKNSDVILRVPPKAVPPGRTYTIHGTIHTNLAEFNDWMLTKDEFIIGPVTEYIVSGGGDFDTPVEITLPHCLRPDMVTDIRVLYETDNGFKEMKNDGEMSYSLGDHCVIIKTTHFTKFIISHSGKEQEISDGLLTVAASKSFTDFKSTIQLRLMLHSNCASLNDFSVVRRQLYDPDMVEIRTGPISFPNREYAIPFPQIKIQLTVDEGYDWKITEDEEQHFNVLQPSTWFSRFIREKQSPAQSTHVMDGRDVLLLPESCPCHISRLLADFTLESEAHRDHVACSIRITFDYGKGIGRKVKNIPIVHPDKNNLNGTEYELPPWDKMSDGALKMLPPSMFEAHINSRRADIVETVDISVMWDMLLQLHVVTQSNKQRIMVNASDYDAVSRLLDHLKQGPLWRFHGFLRACAVTHQEHVITLIGFNAAKYSTN